MSTYIDTVRLSNMKSLVSLRKKETVEIAAEVAGYVTLFKELLKMFTTSYAIGGRPLLLFVKAGLIVIAREARPDRVAGRIGPGRSVPRTQLQLIKRK